MNWKEGFFLKVQVKASADSQYHTSSVWDFGNQAMADAGVVSTLLMHKWCMLLENILNGNKQLMKWQEGVCIGDEGAG